MESMSDLTLSMPLRFFIALALSFLVGLERERSSVATKGRVFAGVRTYSLIGVYGFGCAWLTRVDGAWILPAGLISIVALALAGFKAKQKEGHVGWTSEVTALLTFIMGALCLLADIWFPMALGIIGTFLLSEKAKLEKYVEHLDKTEFLAVVKFLIVTLIILPVLPDQDYTDFNLNPRKIWQIVVLVSAIGFSGYFLTKKFGNRMGLWLSGLLGGIVSSTAVTIAMGRIARQGPGQGIHALQASILAASVMYLRILVLIWFIQPNFVPLIWWKLVALSGVGLLLSICKNSIGPGKGAAYAKTVKNPFELKPALIFASLFVILSVVTVLVTKFYGEAGLLTLAAAVGVTDIDPFILSIVSQPENIQILTVMAILVSMMSNTIAKGVYFGVLTRNLWKPTVWRYALWTVLHLPVILIN